MSVTWCFLFLRGTNIKRCSPFYVCFPLCLSFSGYERYYNKYINVKKGGFGGIAMVLAGYVVLSYVWEYDHISK